jgi:DNA-binding transcriptional ArsR family regulator
MADPSLKTLWLHAVGQAKLGPTTKAVGWAVGAHMSPAGASDPSLPRIADYAGITKARVARHLRLLDEAGLLVVQRSKGGNGKRNVYYATIGTPTLNRLDEKQRRWCTRWLDKNGAAGGTVTALNGAAGTLNGAAESQKRVPLRHPKGLKGFHEDDVNNGARSGERSLNLIKAPSPADDVEIEVVDDAS